MDSGRENLFVEDGAHFLQRASIALREKMDHDRFYDAEIDPWPNLNGV